MTSAIEKPRVFISSTIGDFRDLRSGLRFWLESAGYDVQLSEYTDFRRKPAERTFESCFNNIRNSDIYILFIGWNRGSWYDESTETTVTRQEYRTAKSVETEGTKLFLFVRDEVMQALNQWSADGAREKGTLKSTDWNPRVTLAFTEEIQADADDNGAPWLYRFSDFRDIIAALREPLALDLDIDRRLLRQNLLSEILQNLTSFVSHSGSGFVTVFHHFVSRGRQGIEIPFGATTCDLTIEQVKDIGLLFGATAHYRLRTDAMREVAKRGLFLEVSPEDGELESTIAHEAVLALLEDIERLEKFLLDEDYRDAERKLLHLTREANEGRLNSPVRVSAWDLHRMLIVHDRWDDIFRASTMLAQWLMGVESSPIVPRRPYDPVAGQSEKLEASWVTPAEIKEALKNRWNPFGVEVHPADQEMVERVRQKMIDEWAQELMNALPQDGAGLDPTAVREAVRTLFYQNLHLQADPRLRTSW